MSCFPSVSPALVPTRIVVADAHPMTRLGLSIVLNELPGRAQVDEAGDSVQARALLERLRPALALIDTRLGGVDMVATLRAHLPQTRFMLLAPRADAQQLRHALAAGANGFVVKTVSKDNLLAAIQQVLIGRRALCPEAMEQLMDAPPAASPVNRLTARQLELLALLARGFNNKAIARALHISVPTAKFHVTNILVKLGVDSRTEAALFALKHRMVPTDGTPNESSYRASCH